MMICYHPHPPHPHTLRTLKVTLTGTLTDDPTRASRGLICDWYRIGLSVLHSVQSLPIQLKQELDIEANSNLFKLSMHVLIIYCDLVISGPAHDKHKSTDRAGICIFIWFIYQWYTKLLGVTKPSSSGFIFKEHYLLHDINGLYLSKPFFFPNLSLTQTVDNGMPCDRILMCAIFSQLNS